MRDYTLLVFPCGTEIANEIIESLNHHKYFHTVFASSERGSYCEFRGKPVHALPYVTDTAFEDSLKELVDREKIDFIIPAHDDVAYALSRLDGALGEKVIGQRAEVNEIVRFKDRTYAFFTDILPIAKLYETPEAIRYPCFVKPKRGQGSADAFIIEDERAYARFTERFDPKEFVTMEYLPGEEYTIDCFSDRGRLLYSGGRTREKTTRGISVISSWVRDENLQEEFRNYAQLISEKLHLHGFWFFQMKRNTEGALCLLEIGPRVSGTMMLNRARGINFVELALYQKLGFEVEITPNDIEVSLGRALVPRYKSNIEYESVYIDFDDTLFLEEKYINTELMKLIFQTKNEGKSVYLITKNKKNNLAKTLHRFGITHIFDGIIHLRKEEKKVEYMQKNSILIDDSFAERAEAIRCGFCAFSVDGIDLLTRG